MKSKLSKYLFVGYIFAFVVESINMGIGQGNWIGMIVTVLLFYGLFILISYVAYKYNVSKLLHFLIFGLIGLQLEWLVFQPNPFEGRLWVVILVNIGMFAHWATVAFAPRMLLDENLEQNFKSSFLKIFFGGMIVVFGTGLLMNSNFTVMIIGNVLLYIVLMVWYINYIRLK